MSDFFGEAVRNSAEPRGTALNTNSQIASAYVVDLYQVLCEDEFSVDESEELSGFKCEKLKRGL